MHLNPYLSFNGECESAFKFYAEVLGGKIEGIMKYAGTPAEEHVSTEWRDKTMHAHLNLGEASLMGADVPPDRYKKPAGVSVTLQLKDTAESERIFAALSEGGNVTMPMQQTFWASRFGMVTDRFGIPWMINCE